MFEFGLAPAPFRLSLWIGLGLYVTGELLAHAEHALESAHRVLGPVERVCESFEAVGL